MMIITITAITDNSCYAVTSGTSFAAPFVSGGLAVIADHFEGQLGSQEIVNRMFAQQIKREFMQIKLFMVKVLWTLDAATEPVGQ